MFLPAMLRNLITAALVFGALAMPAMARGPLPAGFVYLRDIDASIAQDMRYASDDNFTGRPLPGYGAGECVLRRDVAQALARVQADLEHSGLALKVYDCYRPQRAVAAMAAWTKNSRDLSTRRFYPAVPKARLFQGFIAAHSAHSAGIAVDLTLIERGAPAAARLRPRRALRRTAPRRPPNARPTIRSTWAPASTASMPGASPTPRAITAEQKRRRGVLLAAMRARGFRNYFREWWHFSYGARPLSGYDFPIEPRVP